jgi:hypothetical protein
LLDLDCSGVPVGKHLVTMPEASEIVYECPGCGKRVEPGEDYVVAREYPLDPDFRLHIQGRDRAATAERRFHVEHFRWRTGDAVYELVSHEASR